MQRYSTQHSVSRAVTRPLCDATSCQGPLYTQRRQCPHVAAHAQALPGDNTERIEVEDDKYAQIVIFDHITRRKL